jgi:ribosome maturation protein SDO1
MVKLDEAIIARFEFEGEKFEVLVDPDLALKLRRGEKVDFNALLASDSIFRDAKKGELASEELIKKAFGSNDLETVVTKIVREGRVQLTTEQRRQIIEKKRREIINLIARNALNPQTNAPHPVQRIERAIEEARIQIDALKPVSEQVKEVVGKLKKLIPISMEKLRIAFKIPAQFSGKASAILHQYEVKQEEWQSNGSLIAVVEVPAGLKNQLFNELNHLTQGMIESKILDERS